MLMLMLVLMLASLVRTGLKSENHLKLVLNFKVVYYLSVYFVFGAVIEKKNTISWQIRTPLDEKESAYRVWCGA